MQLTDGQAKAYEKIMRWMNGSGDWCFKLGGFAGTGKTTLLQHIINEMDCLPYCCAPTGKAASVLEKKLNDDAMVTTVHKALYSPVEPFTLKLEALMLQFKDDPENKELKKAIAEEKKEMAKERLQFTSKVKQNEYAGKTFIVDEASMITSKMAADFKYSGARVLFVGDPGQLPPVNDKGWFGSESADFTLEKVMRQALENPIIRLSMDIRNNNYIDQKKYKGLDEVKIIGKTELSFEDWLGMDQVLTGSNHLRRKINRFFRKQLGYQEKMPMENEKLICLKNDFEKYNLINGIPATCTKDAYIDEYGEWRFSVLSEDEMKVELPFYSYPFQAHYDYNATEEPWTLRRDLTEFDWAYAITVHKSQGSEWDSVLLADDGFFNRNPNDRKKWLYTAITRAKEKLIWIQD